MAAKPSAPGTIFIAALHLPYTVHFLEQEEPKTNFNGKIGTPRKTSPKQAPSQGRRRPSHMELPRPHIEQIAKTMAMQTPYREAVLGTPNLHDALGAIDPTPPTTPGPNDDLFFKIQTPFHNVPLGSPSDPSVRQPGGLPLKISALKNATAPALPSGPLPGKTEDTNDYFTIPARPVPGRRPKRNSTASDRSSFSRDSRDELNWMIEKTDYGNGGLKNAVEAAVNAGYPGEMVYVGTLGYGTTDVDESTKVNIEGKLREDYNCAVAFVDDKDFDGHYAHYCKEVLWPVFHYQIPDHPKSKAFLDHSWKFFESLNRSIADAIIKDYKKGDTIWVHDYHLLLVPKMLRDALGPDATIGFFLHVGFPSSEVFRCLAHREKLLEGLLGSSLIGFQTEEYARHFLTTCSRLLNLEARNDGVLLDSRYVSVMSLPIGIDPAQIDEKRKEPEVEEWADALQKRYAGKKLLVARDKLDGVRGVRQKLLAFELFLKKYPEWIGKVVLIQVALSTTTIVELQSTVTDIVTRINCQYSNLEYQPVVYLHQDITYHQYIALLEVADCLVVTSLRDGMNLTSHEFVYLQDKTHAPLILSEFTGSAAAFQKGSMIEVNPWDYSQCAEAFNDALIMPEDEKTARWEKLYRSVTYRTAGQWFTQFLDKLTDVQTEQQMRGTSMIPRLSTKSLLESYKKTHRRLFLLDYEGTLVSWGGPNSNIITSPQRVLDLVNDLLEDPNNIVYVMTSRPYSDLEQVFLRVPGVGLIAEGGCFIRPFKRDTWVRLADDNLPWKKAVEEILNYFVERSPGSFVEARQCSYVWHSEKVEDKTSANRTSGELCNHLNDACESYRVHAIPITDGVLVESIDWSKRTAAEKAIDIAAERNWKPDFILVAGDGRDDEPLFEWATEWAKDKEVKNVTTIRVGTGHTHANATVTGVAGVVTALQKLVGDHGYE